MMERTQYTLRELSDVCHVSEAFIASEVRAKRLQKTGIGKDAIFRRDDVEFWLFRERAIEDVSPLL
jgi:hypothetical protein